MREEWKESKADWWRPDPITNVVCTCGEGLTLYEGRDKCPKCKTEYKLETVLYEKKGEE